MKARNKPQIVINIDYSSERQIYIKEDIYVYLDDDEQNIKYLTQEIKDKLIPAIKKAVNEVKLENT